MVIKADRIFVRITGALDDLRGHKVLSVVGLRCLNSKFVHGSLGIYPTCHFCIEFELSVTDTHEEQLRE